MVESNNIMSAEMRSNRHITEGNIDPSKKRVDISASSYDVDEKVLERKKEANIDKTFISELPKEEKVVFTLKEADEHSVSKAKGEEESIKEKFDTIKKNVDKLVNRFQDGEKDVINELFENISPIVDRYVRSRYGGNRIKAQSDVSQEVLLAVHTALPTYERDGDKPFLSFVYGIAAHKVADAHRAQGRDKSDPSAEFPEDLHPAGSSVEEQIIDKDSARSIVEAMNKLPPKQKEIVFLRVLAGYSAEETAEAVGITPGAVRVVQHRALNKLRREETASSEREVKRTTKTPEAKTPEQYAEERKKSDELRAFKKSQKGKALREDILEKLPQRHRESLVLKEEGLTYREIAQKLNTSSGSVGVYLSKGRDEYYTYLSEIVKDSAIPSQEKK